MGSVSENKGGLSRRRQVRDVHLDVGWVDDGAVNCDPAEMTVNLNRGWSPYPNRIGCIFLGCHSLLLVADDLHSPFKQTHEEIKNDAHHLSTFAG